MAPTTRVAAFLAAVATTFAAQIPTALPFNAEVGEFALNLSCTFLGAATYLNGQFYALSPVVGAPGQKIYFSDATTQIVIPQNLNNAAKILGATYAITNTFVDLDFANASPASLSVFPNGLITNTTINQGATTTVYVPKTGVLPAIGPITLGKAGIANFYLGEINSVVTLYNRTSKVFGPYNLTCPAATKRTQLGLVNVAGPTNTTAAKPAIGSQVALPTPSTGQEVGFYHTSLTCTIGTYKNILLDIFFGGLLQGAYPAGSSFSISNINAQVNVPQSFVNTVKSAYNPTSFTTTINTVNIGLSNATPTTKNIISSAISITQNVPSSGGLTLAIPQSGSLTAGPFKAGSASGSYMYLSLGTTAGNLALKDSTGKTTNLAISCGPTTSPFDLYGILIS